MIEMFKFMKKIRESFMEIGLAMREIREFKNIQKITRINVYYFTGDRVSKILGKTNASFEYVMIPALDRVFSIHGCIYYDTKNKPYIILSDKYHRAIDIHRFDSLNAKEFSIDANRMLETKVFEALAQPSKKTTIIIVVFGVLVGLLFAFVVVYYFPSSVCDLYRPEIYHPGGVPR